jgi:hypothetical protein
LILHPCFSPGQENIPGTADSDFNSTQKPYRSVPVRVKLESTPIGIQFFPRLILRA